MVRHSNNQTSERGVVLLISLVILALIVITVVGLSAVLINEIRSARYVDNAIIAHYAAESGAERSLFLLTEARGVDEVVNSGLIFNDATLYNSRELVPGDGERYYQYLTISTTSAQFSTGSLPVNTSVEFDIFDPSQEVVGGAPNTGIDRLIFNWELEDSCVGNHELEVTTIAYTVSGTGIAIDSNQPEKTYYQCNCTGVGADPNVCKVGANDPNFAQSLSSSKFYHVALRPIDSAVASTNIWTVDASDTVIGIPSQINIQTRGEYRDARQVITLQAPWDAAVSDIFDYVIFTETDLIKNVIADVNQPFESLCGVCSNDPNKPCSASNECDTAGPAVYCIVRDPSDALQPFCVDNPAGINEWYNLPQASFDTVQQNATGECNALCTGFTYCGDGTPQTDSYGNGTNTGANGGIEECDDGNNDNTDECSNSCEVTYCGDGITQAPNGKAYVDSAPGTGFVEECDDKNDVDDDNCNNSCVAAACGDGILNGTEVCDRLAATKCTAIGYRTYYVQQVGCPNASDACNATCSACATLAQCTGF